MKNVYNVLTQINQYLEAHPLVNSVTFGDIFEVDLKKQTIFPLAHVMLGDATFTGASLNVVEIQVNIIVMDIVDVSKEDIRDQEVPFNGIDNVQDVLNSTLVVCNGLAADLIRGDLHTDKYQLSSGSDISCNPFMDRFENKLAGWNMTLNIQTPNDELSVCA